MSQAGVTKHPAVIMKLRCHCVFILLSVIFFIIDTRSAFMRKRRLGNTDMEIAVVGLGAWAIGGGGWEFGWGPQDDQKSIDAIHKALDEGVNWIDTAAAYGLGHS